MDSRPVHEKAQEDPARHRRQIGPFRLIRAIGSGGTATVYEAEGPAGDRVALKVIRAALANDDAWWRRVRREATLLGNASHRGLPRVYDVGIDEGLPYLALELLEGRSLEARLAEGRLPVADVLRYADDVLDVLETIHAAGVVHRDLKPSNLFETSDGTVKVLDLGIAGVDASAGERTSHTWGLLGTPAYMSPEQARGRWQLVDARSDLWALAAVMFRFLSGEHVHPAHTPNEQLADAMSRSARPLASVVPELDAPLAAVLDRALSYQREDRWPTARAFREALKSPAESLAVLPRSNETTEREASPRLARKPRIVGARQIVVAGALGVGAALLLTELWGSRATRSRHEENRVPLALETAAKGDGPAGTRPAVDPFVTGPSGQAPVAPRATQGNTSVRAAEPVASAERATPDTARKPRREKAAARSPAPNPLDERLPAIGGRVAEHDPAGPLDRYR